MSESKRWFHGTLTALLLVATGLGAPLLATVGESSSPVFRVNERFVTEAQFEARVAARVQALGGVSLDRERQEQERQNIARQLYEELLLLAQADELGLVVPAEQVDRAFSSAAAAPPFQAAIQGRSQEERLRAVDDLRREIERQLTAREVVRREVESRIEIADEEVAAYYRSHADELREAERLRVREVVVLAHPERPFAETLEVARQLHAAILAGRTLDEAAQEQAATGLVTRPIDLGWVGRDDVDAGLRQALWATPDDGVTPPLEGRGGLHVMQVLERSEPVTPPLEQVATKIRTGLHFVRLGRAVHPYLAGLERRFDIEVAPSVRDLIAAPPGAEGVSESGTDTAPTGDPMALIATTVRAWAEAWSAQQVEGYLGHYAAGFRPPGGLDRTGWERQRRRRIERPQSIRVTIDELQVELAGGGRATARFRQSYASDTYQDEVAKRLELVWEEGRWKILEEATEE